MRILITSDIFPPDTGGPATYVPLIARELARRGHSVRVLTYSAASRYAADSTYPFEVERIMVHAPRVLRLLRTWIRIAANAQQAKVLYINGLLIETALVNMLVQRAAVAKVVGDIAWERARDKGWIAVEFGPFQQRRHGWRIELRRTLRNWALRRSRSVITPSAYLKRIVSDWGIEPHRIHVIYNAVELPTEDGSHAVLPLTTPHRLITVCRLTTWKGVDGLIEAIAPLTEAGLVVVGDGPEKVRLAAMADELGVRDRVFFAGQVAREQVGAYLRACDLFVLNSRYEGLPHVVLEAMAAGLPVVATDVGGISEMVCSGINGQLVKPGDAASLRRAIREVLEDAGLRARCAEEKVHIAQQFSATAMVDATELVLKAAGGRV